MTNLYYKLNNGYYNLYVRVENTLLAVKLAFPSDFKTLKVLIECGAIKPLINSDKERINPNADFEITL